MKWSWKLGEIAGIGIFVHWTFLILLGFIALAQVGQGGGAREVLAAVGFVTVVFGCIVLHELGHAMAARRYHIATRDITLLPIGGLARLERMPEDPHQELVVALAGPLVNVAIAAVLAVVLLLLGGLGTLAQVDWDSLVGGHFLANLLFVNIFLVLFNLLPAFPMDGGRVLRALLHRRMSYVRATQIAASVGQFMAIAFGMFGLLSGQFMLLFIALFVYIGAQEEAHMVQMKSVFKGVPVREAMMTRFRTLVSDDTLATVMDELLAGSQEDFPVVEEGRVIGLLARDDVVKALASTGPSARVGDVMRRDCGGVEETDMLEKTFSRMRETACPLLPVMRGDRLVGLVTLANVGEWMMLHSALENAGPRAETTNLFGGNR
jgi:Zn-dependent protease